MIADRSQTDLIATFRMVDDDLIAINSLTSATPTLEIGYKKYRDLTWTTLTLVPGTLGTYLDSSFIADSGGDGLYEIGIPNISKIAGHRTLWRFKFAANQYRYDSIDYIAIPAAETTGVTLEFAIPGTEDTFTSASQIYIKETDRTITFEANQDISAIPLELVFELGDGTDQFVILDAAMDKSAGDSVVITLPAGFTDEETNLQWAIRHATNKRVYGVGSITVSYAPFVD